VALNLDAVAFSDTADLGSLRTIRSERPLDSLINIRSKTASESPSHTRSKRAALSGPESPSISGRATLFRTELLTYTKSKRSA
jgi:hypothetical protein